MLGNTRKEETIEWLFVGIFFTLLSASTPILHPISFDMPPPLPGIAVAADLLLLIVLLACLRPEERRQAALEGVTANSADHR